MLREKEMSPPRTPLRVSVVIPAYNGRQYVGRAIRSVLEQTLPPSEIIVVDDGSTDGMGELIKQGFGDRVLYHYQENRGPSAARNTGIRLGTGNWIAFLDADDCWAPQKLQFQVAKIVARPEIAMVACEAVLLNSDGTEQSQYHLPRPLTREAIRKGLKVATFFPLAGVMVHRDVFSHLGGFNENLVCGEDREMFARIASHYEIAAVYRPLLRKTDLPTGVSSNPSLIVRDGLIVNRRIIELFGDCRWLGMGWLDHLELRRADSRILISAARMYLQRQETRSAALSIAKAIARWPFSSWKSYWLAGRVWMRLLAKVSIRRWDVGSQTAVHPPGETK